jgi:aspartyl protease family protein
MLGDTLKFASFMLVILLVVAQLAAKVSFNLPGGPASAPVAATPMLAQARVVAPAAPVSALDEYLIPAGAQGHYFANVLLNGQGFEMLVDTGASVVALKSEDAAALGVYPQSSDFTVSINTANGVGHAARVKLREAQIGSIALYDVDAIVCEPGMLQISLLGMTFLSRLSKVEIQSGALLLRK